MSEKYIVDNLKKFGSEFQIKCISGLVSDKTFIERISDILEPDSLRRMHINLLLKKQSVTFFNIKTCQPWQSLRLKLIVLKMIC